MANQQRKGFLYIYKGGTTRNQRKNKKDQFEAASSAVALDQVEKKKSNSSLNWLTRISKLAPSLNVNGINGGQRDQGFVEARKSTSSLEVVGSRGGGYVEGRKSVSAASELGEVVVVEGRKSVSHIERGIVEGRKSVSHIEGNLAAEATRGIYKGRKSVSHIETLSSVTAYLEVKVLVSDMPSFMQVHAFRCARRTYDCLEQFSSKHIAHNIKKEFDKAYGPVWHCIVGSSFGSFVTHATGCFLYFSMDNLHILLFKTKVKKLSD